ncbi:MAG: PEP-CTERM sorting domain-containing protein [Rubripirellula sp.]
MVVAAGDAFLTIGAGTRISSILDTAPVPEPSTLAVFALGGIVAGGSRRRRKQAAMIQR